MKRIPNYCPQPNITRGTTNSTGAAGEIRLDTYIETIDGNRQLINRAYIDMVAINSEGRPVEVPGLVLETDAQRVEYEAAAKRKELRKQRRQEGF